MTQHSRDTPQFYLTAPSPCPYLPERFERKVFAHLPLSDGANVNDSLTQVGFRRSQNIAYRLACDACSACVSARIPAIAELGIRKGYAGLYDMSPDDNPILDQAPGIDGVFYACGSSGHGFKLGAAVGEALADTGAVDQWGDSDPAEVIRRTDTRHL